MELIAGVESQNSRSRWQEKSSIQPGNKLNLQLSAKKDIKILSLSLSPHMDSDRRFLDEFSVELIRAN